MSSVFPSVAGTLLGTVGPKLDLLNFTKLW